MAQMSRSWHTWDTSTEEESLAVAHSTPLTRSYMLERRNNPT